MTSAATPKTVSNLTMARKPKPSAVAEASEPEIVGLKKRVIPAKAAQAAAEPTPSPVPPADAGAAQ